jgi:hypothetical protein
MQTDTRFALLAAAIMHVEGTFSIKSIGWRNNNPGNIRSAAGPFNFYDSMQEGFDALLQDIEENRVLSIADFIHKYAPPNENDTQSYLTEVCCITGFDYNELVGG